MRLNRFHHLAQYTKEIIAYRDDLWIIRLLFTQREIDDRSPTNMGACTLQSIVHLLNMLHPMLIFFFWEDHRMKRAGMCSFC